MISFDYKTCWRAWPGCSVDFYLSQKDESCSVKLWNLEHRNKKLAWSYAFDMTPKVALVLLFMSCVSGHTSCYKTEEFLSLSSPFFPWYTGTETMAAWSVQVRDCPCTCPVTQHTASPTRQNIHRQQWVFISLFRSFSSWIVFSQRSPLTHFVILLSSCNWPEKLFHNPNFCLKHFFFVWLVFFLHQNAPLLNCSIS